MKALLCAAAAVFFLMTPFIHAQDIEAKLAGTSVSSGFTVFDSNNLNLFSVRGNKRVGIGTVTPSATLHVIGNDGFLAVGTYNSGGIPATGAGTRMMWYPKKAAFRSGSVSGTAWDDASIGFHSCAIGRDVTASGEYSVALNYGAVASNSAAFASGLNTTASGLYSTAMGANSTASGDYSTAFGSGCVASDGFSTAMGSGAAASGRFSLAMGKDVTASGDYSVALGSYASTNGREGSFVIGDNSTTTTMNSLYSNRLYARFHQGYILYTSSNKTTGVYALNGASSWSSTSDSTRKENYREAKGEDVLRAFRSLRLGSWNYIGDDQRHYGPMAQEWFSAFGHDGIGTIGNDTTLATADVDGVLCIAMQALERRTAASRKQTALLEQQLVEREQEIADLRTQLESVRNELAQQKVNDELRLTKLEQRQDQRDAIVEQLIRVLEDQQHGSRKRFVQKLQEME